MHNIKPIYALKLENIYMYIGIAGRPTPTCINLTYLGTYLNGQKVEIRFAPNLWASP